MSKLIGDRIYSLRKKLGLSQEEFANRIGVSRQVVSKWEMNQVIPLTDKLKKISEEFNISYDEIFGDKDSIKRNNIIRYILIFLGIIIVEVIIILIYSIDEIINDKIVNIIKSNKSREDYVEINSCK